MLSHTYHVKKKSGYLPAGAKNEDAVFGHTVHFRFWFYKTFVAPTRPILVCEGATDNIYLRNAIRRLAAFHPKLGADAPPDGFKFAVSLFSYTNLVHRILGLRGGYGPLHGLIGGYRKYLVPYKARPMEFPVIVLMDNDTALTQKFCNELKKKFGVDVTHASAEPFFFLTDNLYLVKTPSVPASVMTCIEDLFDDATLALELDGKTFHNEKKDFDSTKHIGKSPFASKIIAPKAVEISWTGFEPLLARIVAVLDHYKPPAAAPP